jgi:MOSC domain-containing protein YiiM
MRIEKVFVGLPKKTKDLHGKPVETGIFKQEIAGPVLVSQSNLAGDGQADLKVHGGLYKAVYAYSAEHYAWWRQQPGHGPEKVPMANLPYGAFGENLTISGFDESKVYLGNVYQIGTVHLEAVQPRFPCFKLGIKFGDASILKTFMQSGRLGIYFRVAQEGELAAGDEVKLISEHSARIPVFDLIQLTQASEEADAGRIRSALSIPNLPPDWKRKLQARLS